MYKNGNYSNKWFYAFIVGMDYVNDNVTNIYLKTDVFQTWQHSLVWKESFVEREMINVNDDVPGANLLPENLETGEYKIGGTAEINDLEPTYIVAYAEDTFGHKYNGIFSGVQFYAFSDVALLYAFLVQINLAGKTDFILTIFTVPKLAFNPNMNINGILDDDIQAIPRRVTLASTPNSLDGYTPRNQKLRTYPYMYVGFNPSNGTSKLFRYENFPNGTPIFDIISEININPTVCFVPQNYRGATNESLSDLCTLSGYPTISWSNDTFNVWMAQNKDIIALDTEKATGDYKRNAISGGIDLVGNLLDSATGAKSEKGGISLSGIFGSANTAVNMAQLDANYEYKIKSQNAMIEQHERLPNTATFGGNNTTLLGYNLLDNNIFTRYTIKRQFAERIDKYFDMFGYLTNTVKIPNLSNRPVWNYVKTIGANILGDIPQLDLAEIKELFNNGITLWHNTNYFLDYSQNNRITDRKENK